MLVSHSWLNKYFDGKLPAPEKVAEALTFHAWEIESVEPIGADTVLDVKVLPDKSMWALSHRGIAKDISAILEIPLMQDPLAETVPAESKNDKIAIDIQSSNCRRFAAARIEGVKVGPSPDWLRASLEAIGQRSINNIVDASNYVMFDLGQPSHAFDATLVGEGGFCVRQAKDGEKIVGLDDKEYLFTTDDTVIARGDTNEILSVAGLKGGKHSGISENTTNIIVEVANWNPVTVRKTGQRLRLRTDASARYENGIVPEMVPYGLKAVVDLIKEVAGGELVGITDHTHIDTLNKVSVSVELEKINKVLGVRLTTAEVSSIIDRFKWDYKLSNEKFEVTPPFERTDLQIGEDLIEEIGRVYGYQHVEAVTPEPLPLTEINQRFYYSEIVRDTLMRLGFSEIFTSSFRETDKIKLANALAADKGYLRSSLVNNMSEALIKNGPQADLLGLEQIKLFEIGTVFNESGEHLQLALGVQSPSGYKAKVDDQMLQEALAALAAVLGIEVKAVGKAGVVELDLGEMVAGLPVVTAYAKSGGEPTVTYRPFSPYPAIARDIAMWVASGESEAEMEKILREPAGQLCVRVTLFDRFEKDERTSYAFRLVFQSKERTLTDVEINEIMDRVYQVVKERGFVVR
jgi:phenylalanyl-tRNA synthetase beta chain